MNIDLSKAQQLISWLTRKIYYNLEKQLSNNKDHLSIKNSRNYNETREYYNLLFEILTAPNGEDIKQSNKELLKIIREEYNSYIKIYGGKELWKR